MAGNTTPNGHIPADERHCSSTDHTAKLLALTGSDAVPREAVDLGMNLEHTRDGQ
jgi:hypothetical protein